MLNKTRNYVFAEIEQLLTVVLLVTLVHYDGVNLDVCCIIAHLCDLLASEHFKNVLDVLLLNGLDVLCKEFDWLGLLVLH